jgi:hypothetical protein
MALVPSESDSPALSIRKGVGVWFQLDVTKFVNRDCHCDTPNKGGVAILRLLVS